MGGEIFKTALNKLEAKSRQKLQENISLETRENSLSNDINFNKNYINLIDEKLSQRTRKREINNFNTKIRKISRKKHKRKSIKDSLINTYKNISKGIKKLYNFTIIGNYLIIKRYIRKIYKLFSYKMEIVDKVKEALDKLDVTTTGFIQSENASKQMEMLASNLIRIQIEKLQNDVSNIFNINQNFNAKDADAIMNRITKDPCEVNFDKDSDKVQDIEAKIKYFTELKETYKQKNICFRCGKIKHMQPHQCNTRCTKCNGPHDSNKCKIKMLICSWCGGIRGHKNDCANNKLARLKSIICPICGLRGHIGNNCNALFLALSSLKPNKTRRIIRKRFRRRNNYFINNKGIPRNRRKNK